MSSAFLIRVIVEMIRLSFTGLRLGHRLWHRCWRGWCLQGNVSYFHIKKEVGIRWNYRRLSGDTVSLHGRNQDGALASLAK